MQFCNVFCSVTQLNQLCQSHKNRVRHRVCHADPWPNPTRPNSSTQWPGDPWPEDPVPILVWGVCSKLCILERRTLRRGVQSGAAGPIWRTTGRGTIAVRNRSDIPHVRQFAGSSTISSGQVRLSSQTAVDAATNSLHCLLLFPGVIHVVCRLWCRILRFLLYSSIQSIRRFSGLPRDRLLLGSHLNTCFTVLLSDIRRMCPVYFIRILLILLLSWIIFVLSLIFLLVEPIFLVIYLFGIYLFAIY